MSTPLAMLKKIKAIKIQELILTVLESNTEIITKYTQQQWKSGERSDGTPIGQYRNKSYAYYKANKSSLVDIGFNPKKPDFGFMDLIDTGETVKSMVTTVSGDSLKQVLKSDRFDLLKRFSDELLGLTKESRVDLILRYLYPQLIELVKEKLS